MSTLDPDPIGGDLGRARRERRFRADAACVLCGTRDPQVLRKAGRSVLEEHHVGGRANDPTTTAVLCLNCHRRQSVRQRSVSVDLDPDQQGTDVERLVSVLCGLALFFEMLAGALVDWAERLTAHVALLDANCAGWRTNELGQS